MKAGSDKILKSNALTLIAANASAVAKYSLGPIFFAVLAFFSHDESHLVVVISHYFTLSFFIALSSLGLELFLFSDKAKNYAEDLLHQVIIYRISSGLIIVVLVNVVSGQGFEFLSIGLYQLGVAILDLLKSDWRRRSLIRLDILVSSAQVGLLLFCGISAFVFFDHNEQFGAAVNYAAAIQFSLAIYFSARVFIFSKKRFSFIGFLLKLSQFVMRERALVFCGFLAILYQYLDLIIVRYLMSEEDFLIHSFVNRALVFFTVGGSGLLLYHRLAGQDKKTTYVIWALQFLAFSILSILYLGVLLGASDDFGRIYILSLPIVLIGFSRFYSAHKTYTQLIHGAFKDRAVWMLICIFIFLALSSVWYAFRMDYAFFLIVLFLAPLVSVYLFMLLMSKKG